LTNERLGKKKNQPVKRFHFKPLSLKGTKKHKKKDSREENNAAEKTCIFFADPL